jgi:FkbM family methyltransferase
LNKDKTNILPLQYAITDREESLYYISSETSFANGGISKTRDHKHGKYIFPEMVKGIVLSDLLEKNYREWLEKLSFIKVDTEGYDKEILKSISDLISTYRPVIVTENFENNTDEERMELYQVITQHDYRLY